MSATGLGWVLAILIGALAGWIASSLMKSNTGLFLNIVLGIVGAAVANFLFGIIGISFSGIIGSLIAGVIGASILIALVRAVR
ncbi:MAG: GlsB/YeaQ/YmgE family stress response membrane protein [Maritimibacter sp.]|nr:GlsB/YeaQ/YmgE family stress response membrane protein [Maritimibacter sp.]